MTYQLDVIGDRGVVARFCALAEQRLEYLTDLLETGRWRRFHSEHAFLENIREAKAAVEIWRDLSSRASSSDNRSIDFSWLRRTGRRREISRDPVYSVQPAKSSEPKPPENSILIKAGPNLVESAPIKSAPHEDTSDLTKKLAAIAERYPLLRNRL
jgi:uncharacterized repeat protein (TIGR03809 family)